MASILYIIERFSGIIAMVIGWFFVFTPALKFGINNKIDTISSSTTKSEPVRIVISCGIAIGSMFQLMFLFYLLRRFSIQLYNLGSILFLTSFIATFSVAFFTLSKYPKIHYVMALYCFLVGPFSLLFIGVSAKSSSQYPLLVSVVAPIAYFLGQAFLWKKYRLTNALMELWGLVILTIWTVIMSFI